MTSDDAVAVALYLATAYRQTLTKPEIGIWVEGIGDLDRVMARDTARRVIRLERFMPTIAGFREHYRDLVALLPGQALIGFDGKALPPGVAS